MIRQCLRHQWRSGSPVTLRAQGASRLHTFAEHDYVVLQSKSNRTDKPLFLGPLTPGKRHDTHKGLISHDDIINQSARSLVSVQTTKAKRAAQYRLHEATLEDYVRFTRRLVTPIYPSDANLIVDLYDLHPQPSDEVADTGKEPEISFLEAGTGHGALTLYLSRAVHAANSAAPDRSAFDDDDLYAASLESWRNTRRAVIHTVDVSAIYSKHASKTVKGFKQGMYHTNVDFHVSDVSSWVAGQLADRNGQPFLTHAFLDLPSVESHVDSVARALKVDSTLIVFTPSITQITELMLKVKREGIALDLEKVVELVVNGGSGGREWDVRPVRPRATIKALEVETREDADTSSTESEFLQADAAEKIVKTRADYNDGTWTVVCRPKVGDRVVGGGFLAVYKKHQTSLETAPSEA